MRYMRSFPALLPAIWHRVHVTPGGLGRLDHRSRTARFPRCIAISGRWKRYSTIKKMTTSLSKGKKTISKVRHAQQIVMIGAEPGPDRRVLPGEWPKCIESRATGRR